MRRCLPVIIAGALLAQPAMARDAPDEARRAAFREAIDDYQMFVVPHCAPEDVSAYVAARADRDRVFVRSLRGTVLEADYRQAVADRTERDRNTIYECTGPPQERRPTPAQLKAARRASLANHFEAGDQQFATMLRLRDELIASPPH